jgi:hypothetical protein
MDLHPGYFGHIKFAELLDGYIKEKYDTFWYLLKIWIV